MINEITEALKLNLIKRLQAHHSVYDVPCTSEFLEELISKALAESGLKNDWKPNRKHTISVDMTLENGISLSVKSGEYKPKKRILKFSGSRLGKHKILEKMVASIEKTTADYYVSISRIKKEWDPCPGPEDTKIYYLTVFPANIMTYDGDWVTEKTDKGNTIYKLYKHGLDAAIIPSMSYQLWTDLFIDTLGISIHKLDIMPL